MYLQLLPEIVGLALTPAALAGCILLLESRRPIANALSFAAAFLVLYLAVSVIVLSIGSTVTPGSDATHARSVVSLTVGLLFLVLGLAVAFHGRGDHKDMPRWAVILEQCSPPTAFIAGAVLAIANPNLFILLAGLGTIATETTDDGSAAWGATALLGGVAIDFVVPIVAFVVFGDRAVEGSWRPGVG